MLFLTIKRMFKNGNVCVTGLRGAGKDTLMGNVIARQYRHKLYASNLDYTHGKNFVPVDFKAMNLGENDYKAFVSGNLKQYVYPYPLGSDIFISDAGVYFPSQYCNELNRDFKYFPAFFALSRQVARANIHINVQNLNRCWDKIREQSRTYICCRWCKVLFHKLVIQKVTIYDKYDACLRDVDPIKIQAPALNPQALEQARVAREQFKERNGKVRNGILIYWNKSKHDPYYFEYLLRTSRKEQNDEKNK